MMLFLRTLALCLAMVLGTANAFAHAALVGSTPGDGAMLETSPDTLALQFSEPVSPLVIALVGSDGRSQSLEASVAGTSVTLTLPGALDDGTYALTWRVVSIDGHPVAGSLVFSVGEPVGQAPVAVVTVDRNLAAAIVVARVTIYLGIFFGVGALFFAAFIAGAPAVARQVAVLLTLLALPAVALSVGLQGVDALGLTLGGLGEAAAWRAGFATSWGIAAVLLGVALFAALAGFRNTGFVRQVAAVVALAAAGAAFASTGHASAAAPQWLTRPAVFLHVVAVATWVGALLPLALLLADDRMAALAALRRFSAYIPWSVGALLAAGVALVVVQVGRPEALLTTAYGRVLLFKLALVAVLFVLALINRAWLTRPILAGDAGAARHLRWSVGVEVTLVAVILAVIPLWRFTPPPRALEIAASMPATTHIHTDKAMADISVAPGRAGPVTVTIVLRSPDFGAFAAKEVTVTFANPDAGIEPIRRLAVNGGEGSWMIDGLALPVAGTWQVRVAVLVTDFDLVNLDGDVTLR